MKRNIKRLSAMMLAAAMVLTELNTVSVFADTVSDDGAEIQEMTETEETEPLVETEEMYETEEVPETESAQEETDQTVSESETEAETVSESEMAPEIRTITGFEGWDYDQEALTFSYDEKPSQETLVSMMPSSLQVYLDDSSELTEIPVTWACVGEDYASTDSYYYQFSPVFDETQYVLDDSMNLYADAPYVPVFLESTSDIQLMISDSVAESNAVTIYNFLRSNMGLNSAAACGVLANIECESGFDPTTYGDYGTSYGICQWHASRFTNLKNYCNTYGYDWTTIQGQLYYLKYELEKSYTAVLSYLKSVSNTSGGAYNAGYYWCYHFEIPANYSSVSVTRGNLAQNTYWPVYGNKAVTQTTTATSKVATVALSSVVNTANGIKVTWTPVSTVKGYYLYRKLSTATDWSLVKVLSGASTSSYEDTDVVSGKIYNYAISGYTGDIFDQYVTTDALNYRTTAGTSGTVAGTLNKGTYVNVYSGYSTTANGYTWFKIYYNGGTYYIASSYLKLVKKNIDTSEVTLGSKSEAKTIICLAAPVMDKAVNVADGIKVSWKQVAGAHGYCVYRKVSGGSYSRIATLSGASVLSYTDTTAASGKDYIYTVRPYAGATAGMFKSTLTIRCLAAPVLSSVANTTSGIKVSWQKAAGASGYKIYRKAGSGDWAVLTSVSGQSTVSYEDKAVTAGTSYAYTVRAVYGDYTSWYKAGLTAVRLTAPSLTSLTSTAAGMKLVWQQVSGASGYRVYRKTAGGKWGQIASISKGTTTAYTDTTAAYGTTYYYTVRAVKGSSLSWFNTTGLSAKCTVKFLNFVTTDSLNYRDGAGTSYDVIGTLTKGTQVKVVSGYTKQADGYTWYRLCINNKFYYAIKNYLKKN